MMQAPGMPGAPQQAPMTTGRSTEPLGEQLVVPAHIKNNHDVLNFNKIFVSLLAGCFTGIIGITGFKGFLVYLLAHLLLGCLLLLKAAPQPKKFFPSASTLVIGGMFSQTELLTFVLFWMLSNNMVYLF